MTSRAQLITRLNAGLKSPLLWGPILGVTVTLTGFRLPAAIAGCFELIGSATSGAAVFAVGLVLAAHVCPLPFWLAFWRVSCDDYKL
jgi:predicted permease